MVAIAWMKQAAEQYFGQAVAMHNYRLLKGIVFDGTEPGHCYLTLENKADALEIKVSSLNAAGKPVFHYVAEFVEAADAPLASKPLLLGEAKDAAYLYKNGTLFHGPSLQGIQQITYCDNKVLQLRCMISEQAASKKGVLALEQSNIFANDLVYQAMLVWVREQKAMGSLPSATTAWQFYREVEVDQPFNLRLDVIEDKASECVANVQLIDIQGLLLADAQGVKVTVSASLNALFGDESSSQNNG